MKDNWIVVARAFKCFKISINAAALALILLFCSAIVGLSSLTTSTCYYLVFVPSIIAAAIGFGYSLVGRLLLLSVPKEVPNARYYALSSFTLEMLCLTSLGGYLSVLWAGIAIDRPLAIAWMAVSAVAGLVGTGYFLRFMHLLVEHFGRPEIRDELRTIRTQLIALLAFTAIAIIISRNETMGNLLISGILLIIALVILGSSMSRYPRVLKSLRFSALREAVWCEREGVEPEP